MKNKIEVTVRALIQYEDRFLLAKEKGKDYYFFPGGHVDPGEGAREALKREIREETDLNIDKLSFIGEHENIYKENKKVHNEIIFVFATKVKDSNVVSKESHLNFFFKTKEELRKEKILPKALTKAVLKWLSDRKSFCTAR